MAAKKSRMAAKNPRWPPKNPTLMDLRPRKLSVLLLHPPPPPPLVRETPKEPIGLKSTHYSVSQNVCYFEQVPNSKAQFVLVRFSITIAKLSNKGKCNIRTGSHQQWPTFPRLLPCDIYFLYLCYGSRHLTPYEPVFSVSTYKLTTSWNWLPATGCAQSQIKHNKKAYIQRVFGSFPFSETQGDLSEGRKFRADTRVEWNLNY